MASACGSRETLAKKLVPRSSIVRALFEHRFGRVPRTLRMIHLHPMTKHEMPTHGANAPQPVRSLRDWLDHLAARGRLAVLKPKIGLKFELAAYAKRLDGQRATLFPQPGGHAIPVVSGLVSDRGWMAEAMGVEPAEVLTRFQDAALNPIAWRETASAPAQEVVHREIDLTRLLPLPVHNEHDSGPYVTAGLMITRNPRTG